ncbi:MAG: type I secretion C-terminal target domain-containing protein [Xanthobacteraceae bacterium]|nr:type I secretion C-terminal target domain-containing protein [Xanthobacteraceae bacterium]
MNAPIRVAQVGGAASGSKPVRILKIEKPASGQAVTAEASYDGTVKIDFGAIANEKITLVHVGETLIILFDNQSTVTIVPFFDSMGVPLANISIESNGKEFSSTEFASTFPITTDQSVLPAAGDGAGTPASGANFSNASVDPLLSPNPLPLLGPEELPNIVFTRIEGAEVNDFPALELLGPLTGMVEEEQFLVGPTQFSDAGIGNEDINDASGFDTDTPGDFNIITLVTTGDLATIIGGGVPPYSFSLEDLENDPVLDNDGNPITSIQDPVVYRNFVAGPPASIEGWTVPNGELEPSRHVFTLELNQDGTFTFTLVDTIDHPDATTGNGDGTQEETLFIDFSDLVRVTDSVGQTAIIGDFSDEPVFSVGVIDDTPIADLDPGQISAVAVDETIDPTFDDGANFADESHPDAPLGAIGFVQASLGSIYADNSLPGADLPDSRTYSLVLNGTNSGLLYSVTNAPILLAQLANGNIVGYIGAVSPNDPAFDSANKVFEFSIDSGSGEITLVQYKPVEHPTAGDFGTPDQDEPTAMAEGIVGVGVHVTDGDEDAANDTIDIGSHFNFEDDGIFVDVFRVEGEGEGSGTFQIDPPTIELDESIDSANDGFDDPPTGEDTYATGEAQDDNGDHDDVDGVTEPSLLLAADLTADGDFAIGIKSTPTDGNGSIASLFDFNVVAGTDLENDSARTEAYSWSLYGPSGDPAGEDGVETTLRVTALDETAVAGVDNPALENLAGDPAARTIFLFQVSPTEIVGKIGQDTPETTDDYVAVRFLIDAATGQITVEQYLPFEHGDTTRFDESLTLALALGGDEEDGARLDVTYTVRVEDNDGDFNEDSESVTLATTDSEVGSFVFDDDGPQANVDNETTTGSEGESGAGGSRVPLQLAQLNLDETFDIQPPDGEDRYVAGETEDDNGDLDDVGSPFNATNLTTDVDFAVAFGKLSTAAGSGGDEGDLGDLFTTPVVDYGTDGPALIDPLTQLFTIELGGAGASGETPTGVKTTLSVTKVDGSVLEGLSDANRVIYLFEEDGVIVGRIGQADADPTNDYVALKIYVENPTDPITAQLTIEQIIPLEHPDTSLHDEQIPLALVGANGEDNPTLTLKLTVTATDGDGDPVTDSAEVLLADKTSDNETAAFTFDDDGPVVTAETTCEEVPPTPGKDANFVLVLDSSGSVDGSQLALIKANAIDFINDAAASGAENIRIHIVDFDSNSRVVGTFDIVIGGEPQDDAGDAKGDQVQAAIDAINAMVGGGFTNYEAALSQAKEWIEGGTVAVTNAHEFDADTDSGENEAFVLTDANGVRIAVVSAWEPFATNTLGDADSDADGFGVTDDDELDETDEMLRFDFGAFNDFDGAGEFGLDGEAAGFRGSEISAATFSLRDFDAGANSVNYRVFYTDGTDSGLINLPFNGATSLNNLITAPAGKLIAYMEFTVPAGEGGRVDLESVVIGTGPMLDADVNKVIFFSDGEPNRALEDDGDVITVNAANALLQSNNEILAIETDDDAGGPNQAFGIEAFGANADGDGLDVLDAIDSNDAQNVTTNTGLGDALASLLESLAGADNDCPPIVIHDETPLVQSGTGTPATNTNDQNDVLGSSLPQPILDLFNAIVTAGIQGEDTHVSEVQEDNQAIGFARGGTQDVGLTYTADYGTDGPNANNALQVDYNLHVVDGTFSGLQTTEGANILLYNGTGSLDGLILGRVGGAQGAVAFALTADPTTGELFVAQYLSIKHLDPGNGSGGTYDEVARIAEGAVFATVTVTDGDGDTATSQQVDVGDRIGFSDDGPDAAFTLNVSASVILDESVGTGGSSKDENGNRIPNDELGAPASPVGGTVIGYGTIALASLLTDNANAGSDGGTTSYALTSNANGDGFPVNGAGTQVGIDSGLDDAQTNQSIMLFSEGGNVVGRVGSDTGAIAFVIQLSGTSLSVWQHRAIEHDDVNDHDEGNDPTDDSAVDDAALIQSLAGKLFLTQTVTDGDGDFDKHTADIGGRFVFEDDGPDAAFTVNASATLVMDESVGTSGSTKDENGNRIPNDESGAPSSPAGGGVIGHASIALSSLITSTADAGSDGGTITYSLSSDANGTGFPVNGSGTQVGIDSGLDDAATNASIFLFSEGGNVVGRVGSDTGSIAFVIQVTGTTLSIWQHRAIEHDDINDHDEGNDPTDDSAVDDAALIQSLAGKIFLTQTVTDNDGDFDRHTVGIGDRFVFEDDGPDASFTLESGKYLELDESLGTGGSTKDEGSGDADNDDEVGAPAAPVAGTVIGYDSISLSSLIDDNSSTGSDGGTTTYALTSSSSGAGFPVNGAGTQVGIDSGLDDAATNTSIFLFSEGGNVVGRVGSDTGSIAFVIQLSGTTLSVWQFIAIEHDDVNDHDEGNDPTDDSAVDDAALIQSLAGKIFLTQTVTDNDGDFDSHTVDIGGRFKFEDDGPDAAFTLSTATSATLVLDESVGTAGSSKDENGNRVPNDESGAPASPAGGTVIGHASIALSSLITDNSSTGTDGGTTTYALTSSSSGAGFPVNGAGTQVGIDSGLDDAATNASIFLFSEGGNVVGRVGNDTGAIAFVIQLSGTTLSVWQHLAIEHDDINDHDEGNDPTDDAAVDDAALIQSLAGKLFLTQTVTDGDGDFDRHTVDIGGRFVFEDDGPDALFALSTATNATLVLDESVGTAGSSKDENGNRIPNDEAGAPAAPVAGTVIGYATIGLASLITDSSDAGSDGGTTTYALTSSVSGAGFPVNTGAAGDVGIDSGLDDAATNASIFLFSEGGNVVGRVGNDTGAIAFVIQLNGTTLSAWQFLAIEHDDINDHDEGNDPTDDAAVDDAALIQSLAGKLFLTQTVTDGDGDFDRHTVDIGGRFVFEDDGPDAAFTLTTATMVLDESVGTAGSSKDENGNRIPNDESGAPASPAGLAIIGYATAGLATLITSTADAGSDGGTTTYALTSSASGAGFPINTGAAGDVGIDSGLDDAATNASIFLFSEGGNIVGRVGNDTGAIAFVIQLSGTTLSVWQHRAIEHDDINDHDEGNDPTDDSAVDDAALIQSLAGKIFLTQTVTDGDGDFDSQTTDIGGQIRFEDDGPDALFTLSTATSANLVLDESVGTAGSSKDEDGNRIPNDESGAPAAPVAGTVIGYATIGLASLITDSSDAGSDGGTTTYALTSSVSGAGFPVNTGAAGDVGIDSGLDDAATNASIFLFSEGGNVVGRVGNDTGAIAFVIQLNGTTLSAWQFLAIEHDDINDHDEGNDPTDDAAVDDAALIQSLAGKLFLTQTVTDGDGDFDSHTVDIGGRFVFEDDGPDAAFTLTTATMVLDESVGTDGSNKDENGNRLPNDESGAPASPAGLAIIGYATAGLATLITSTADAGSDGGATTYALTSSASGAGFPINTGAAGDVGIDSGLDDAASNQSIFLFSEGGNVVGRVGNDTGAIAFVIQLSGTTLSVWQHLAIEHDDVNDHDEGNDPTDDAALDDAALIQSLAGKLFLTQTVTDNDGDFDRHTVDIGGQVRFEDDGPNAGNSETIVTVDEDGLPLGIAGGLGDAVVPNTDLDNNESTNIGTLAGLFSGGSDGVKSLDLALNTGAVSVLNQNNATIPLTSNSNAVFYFWDAATGTLYGSTNVSGANDAAKLANAQATKVFTIVLEADGDYSVKLWQQVDHPIEDDPSTTGTVEISYEDNLTLSLTYRVTDNDDDFATGSFQVMIDDDTPVPFNPATAEMSNPGVVGNSDAQSFALNFFPEAVGADQTGNVVFNLASQGVAAKDTNGNQLSMGGEQLFLFSSVDGHTLTAKTADGDVAFTVTLNTATDTYTVDLEGAVRNSAQFTFSVATNGIQGGNTDGYALTKSATLPSDGIIITGANGAVQDSINTSSGRLAVGNAQSIGAGEKIRFDFVTNITKDLVAPITQSGFDYDAHTATSSVAQQVVQTLANNPTTLVLRAFNSDEDDVLILDTDNEVLVPLTAAEVKVYTGDPSLPGAVQVLSGTNGLTISEAAGVVTIAGMQQGWWYEIVSDLTFEALEVSHGGGATFDLGNIGVRTENALAPFDILLPLLGTDQDGDGIQDSLTISLEPPPPSGANNTINLTEDVTHVFQASQFGFTDPQGDAFGGVVITTLPGLATAGKLMLGNVAVTIGQFISAAEIAAGMLTWAPADNVFGAAGTTSFTFQVQDSLGSMDPTPNTMNLSMGANLPETTASAGTTLFGLTSVDPIRSIVDDASSSGIGVIGSGTTFTSLNFLGSDNNLEVYWDGGTQQRIVTAINQFGGSAFATFEFNGTSSFAGFSLNGTTFNLDPDFAGGSGNDIIAGTAGSQTLLGGSGNDLLFGNGGNDILKGETGNDLMVGGLGIDQFRLATNAGSSGTTGGDVVADYVAGVDKIGLLEGAGAGAVDFVVTGIAAGAQLQAGGDFITRSTVSAIGNGDDNKVIQITSAQTNTEITTTVIGGGGSPDNNYVLVFNSSAGRGQIWFDANWENTTGRVLVATLDSVTSLSGLTAITASDFVVYNNAADPLILDLGASGIALSGVADGVSFDINADGLPDRMAWTVGEDGILALDVDGNGTIDNGTEIFSPSFAGGEHAGSLAALATLDDNADGLIDTGDSAYGSLKVWQDLDHDGVSDAGELTSLAALGITGINLGATPVDGYVNGQQLLSEGSFTYADGSSGSFVEVAFDTELGEAVTGNSGPCMPAPADGEIYVIGADQTQAPLTIEGFVNGDRLDLSALLDANFADGDNVDDFVRLEQDGADIKVQVDTSGPSGGANFVDVAVLAGYGTSNADIVRVAFENQTQQLSA